MKKIITTIIVTVLLLLFAIFYFGTVIFATWTEAIPVVPIVILIIALGIGGAIIYNMLERIKEIRRGDEDDISKY